MKKIMIALGAIASAVSLQAATANWTALTFDSTQTDMATYTPKAFQWAIVETATADNSGYKFEGGVLSGGSAFAGGAVTDVQTPNIFNGEQMSGSLDNATAGNYYSLLIYAADSGLWGISAATLAEVDPTIEGGGTLIDMMFANGEDPYGMQAPSVIASQSVPEPTSGLLLLLGMGAMALRRRRA